MTSVWDESEKWYSSIVKEDGHYYHKNIILPNLLKLLGKFHSLIDLGCGQGVLARALPAEVDYLGIDISKPLIQEAQKLSPEKTFLVQDVAEPFNLEKQDFERAVMLLSLQNMKEGRVACENAERHLKKGGKLIIVLNHPAFRIPRQSEWGFDEGKKLQYRRVDSYMSGMEIPITTHPGKARSPTTLSYHHPISTYFSWLKRFDIEELEEWCSDKKSTGKRAKIEDRARKEFPLFLAIKARKR